MEVLTGSTIVGQKRSSSGSAKKQVIKTERKNTKNTNTISYTASMTKRGNKRETKNGAAKLMAGMNELQRDLAMVLHDHMKALDIARNEFVVSGQDLEKRLNELTGEMFSPYQQQNFDRSAKLERFMAEKRDSPGRSGYTHAGAPTTEDRYNIRKANRMNVERRNLMEVVVVDDTVSEEYSPLNRTTNSSAGNSTNIFGNSAMKVTSSTVKETLSGAKVLFHTVQGKDYDVFQREALVALINSQKLSKYGGRGKKGEVSPETKYILEKVALLEKENYRGISMPNVKKWMNCVKLGLPIPGPKRGPRPLISMPRLSEVLDQVRIRHREKNAMRRDQVDALLQLAILKTAEDYDEEPPSSTIDMKASTMDRYYDTLSPFLLETKNAQDKATTQERTDKANDIRMVLAAVAAVKAAQTGPILNLASRHAEDNPMHPELQFNTDITGFGLKGGRDGKMSITVIAHEDAALPVQANATSNGFEQTIKLMGVGSAAGGTGNDVLYYRYVKPSEIKNGSNQNIFKMKLPFNGHVIHFWLVKKNSDMIEFNYQMIEEFLFPLFLKERDRVCGLKSGDPLVAKFHRMLWYFDGEGPFVAALLKFMKTDKYKNALVVSVKGSPTCSQNLQPMDTCPCFKNSKANTKSWNASSHYAQAIANEVSNDDSIDSDSFTVIDPDEGYDEATVNVVLHKELKRVGVALQHIKDIEKFFFRMQSIYPAAFTRRKIALGWALAGLYPFRPQLVLSKCKGYTQLGKAQRRDVLNSILPKMVTEMSKNGECTDEFMDTLELSAGVYAVPGQPNKVLQAFDKKKAINQRRGYILSHPVQVHKRLMLLSKAQEDKLERIEMARPRLIAIKHLLTGDVNADLKGTGTIPELRGVLDLLSVPESEYLGNTGNLKSTMNKTKICILVAQKTILAMAADVQAAAHLAVGGAGNGGDGGGANDDEYDDDGFEVEDDDDDL
jgi:hypothetical protein